MFLATPGYRDGGFDGGRETGGRAPPPPPPGGRDGGVGRGDTALRIDPVFQVNNDMSLSPFFTIKKTAPRILTQVPSPLF